MHVPRLSRSALGVFAAGVMLAGCGTAQNVLSSPAQQRAREYTGKFADGATYLIEVPASWNRTLLLYSHGYWSAGMTLQPDDGNLGLGEPTHSYLLVLCLGQVTLIELLGI
jgi:hypothetical protein